MQKTFSIAALLTLTSVVAAIASGVLVSQKPEPAKAGVAVTLLPHHSGAGSLPENHREIMEDSIARLVKDTMARVMTEALSSALGGTGRDIAVESWQVNTSDGSLVIHASWTDVATGEARPHKLELAANSDGEYVGEIIRPAGTGGKEGQDIVIRLGEHDRDSDRQ